MDSRKRLTPGLVAMTKWGEVVRICAMDEVSLVVESDSGKRELSAGDIARTYATAPCRGADERYLDGLRETRLEIPEEDET